MDKAVQNVPDKMDVAAHFQTDNVQLMLDMANQFFKAGCFGADVKNPQQAFVKIQAGKEMGMPPMEAMNSLYIVNGKITIWGSAMVKRLRESGWKIEYKEDEGSCTAIITKDGEKYEYTATKDEILKLNSRAFKFAPKEKLRYHAVSRLIRFNVPEILGCNMYAKEEAEDIRVTAEVKDVTAKSNKVKELIDEIEKAKDMKAFAKATNKVGLTVGLSEDDMDEIRGAAIMKKKELEKPAKKIEPPKAESKDSEEYPLTNKKDASN
jgi:hypothetical protein